MINDEQMNVQLLKEKIKGILLKSPEILELLSEAPPTRPRAGVFGLYDVWKYLKNRDLIKYLIPDIRNYFKAVRHGKKGPRHPKGLTKKGLDVTRQAVRMATIPVGQAGYLVAHGSWKMVVTAKKIWFIGPGMRKPRLWAWPTSWYLLEYYRQYLNDNPAVRDRLMKKYGTDFTDIAAFMPQELVTALILSTTANVMMIDNVDLQKSPRYGWLFGGAAIGDKKRWYSTFYLPWFGSDLSRRRCWMKNGRKYCGASILSPKTLELVLAAAGKYGEKFKGAYEKGAAGAEDVLDTGISTAKGAVEGSKEWLLNKRIERCRNYLKKSGHDEEEVEKISDGDIKKNYIDAKPSKCPIFVRGAYEYSK